MPAGRPTGILLLSVIPDGWLTRKKCSVRFMPPGKYIFLSTTCQERPPGNLYQEAFLPTYTCRFSRQEFVLGKLQRSCIPVSRWPSLLHHDVFFSYSCRKSNVLNPDATDVTLFHRDHVRIDLYDNIRLHISSLVPYIQINKVHYKATMVPSTKGPSNYNNTSKIRRLATTTRCQFSFLNHTGYTSPQKSV